MKLKRKISNFLFGGFTILIIPKTTKTTKQFKFNTLATYSLLVAFIVLNIFVSISSVIFYNKSQNLDSENVYLSTALKTNQSTISVLEDKTLYQDLEINKLSEENTAVLDYLNNRIIEVNDLRSQLTETIATFNEANNSDISIPISRSLDSTSIDTIYESKNYDDQNAEPDFDELQKQDELTLVIKDLKLESNTLINEIENELEYLSCLPDLVPVDGRLSSGFGYRIHPITGYRSFHYGIDITQNRGTPVHAAGSGVVMFAGYSGGFGKVIIISHGYGYETVYAHNNKTYVQVGDIVSKGDIISEVGNTGNSTGPHLHFEIHVNDKPVDPKSILKFN